MRREKDKEKETTAWTKSLEGLTEKMNASNASRDPGLERLMEMLEKKWSEEDKANPRSMAGVVKPVKVPTWTKDMTLETFERQLDIWKMTNVDVPENTEFQDLIESLKINKEIGELPKYVSEHIFTMLNTLEKQTIKEIVDCLKERFGRTRQEKIEELVSE